MPTIVSVGLNKAPGSNTQVVFNNSGRMGASADFVWDDSLKKLVLGGVLHTAAGTAGAPGWATPGDTDTGFFWFSSGNVVFATDGNPRLKLSGHFTLGANSTVRWNSDVSPTVGTDDVFLARDAANILGLRNGASAQSFRVYGTFADASNYERAALEYNAGTSRFRLLTAAAGTGTVRGLVFGTGGVESWGISASGNQWIPLTDNTYDVGSTSLRVRDIYGAGTIRLGTSPAASGAIRIAHASQIIGRNSANSADLNVIAFGAIAANETRFGSSGGQTRITSNNAAPTTPANGDWWVECVGTSPNRVCAIKVQDGGSTRVIASVTY